MSSREAYWEDLGRALAEAGNAVRREEPMKKHTTFQAGGAAALFAEPQTTAQLAAAIRICREAEAPFTVVGRGSNLLVCDEGYEGVVLHIGEAMSQITVDGCTLEARAGAQLSSMARAALQASLSGLAFAAGIPGSLGGALVMNAGAYGGEMKDVITKVHILDPREGSDAWLPASEMAFGYRTSRLQKEGWIALGAVLELEPGDPDAIRAEMNDLAERRRSKQPLEFPSAGSTFKRPEGYFAGKLIQDAGLAGFSVGGACVSEKHCGFVVNKGNATAADILAVCRHVEEEVERQFGVRLEMEVKTLGFQS